MRSSKLRSLSNRGLALPSRMTVQHHGFSPYTDNGGYSTSSSLHHPLMLLPIEPPWLLLERTFALLLLTQDNLRAISLIHAMLPRPMHCTFICHRPYSPLTRTNKAVLATNGYHADGQKMTKDLLSNIRVPFLAHRSDSIFIGRCTNTSTERTCRSPQSPN
jgi:hypothetical protein